MCLSFPFRRQMDEDKPGVLQTPIASQAAYRNNALGFFADPARREKKAGMMMHTEEGGFQQVATTTAIPTSINADAPEDVDVAAAEAAANVDLGMMAPGPQPIQMSSAHPAADGYASRFLGFSKFRRNMAKKMNY